MLKIYKNIGFILLLIFSFVIALGPFNPFGSNEIHETENTSSPLGLAIQGLFIVYLLFCVGKNKFIRRQKILLWSFASIWLFSSVLFATEVPPSFWVNFLKLILCIILYCKLPIFIKNDPKAFQWTILIFSLTSATIATLFILGFLNSYLIWSGGRVLLFAENPNSMSTRMCFAMLFIFYIVYENPFGWKIWRFSIFILWIPLMFTILASGSRGSFIVFVVCLALYLWCLPVKNAFSKYAFIGVCAIGVFLLINNIMNQNSDFTMFDRLIDSIDNGTDAGRTELSSAARQIFLDNFIVGVGAPEFTNIMQMKYGFSLTVHNNYWYVLATSGIIGFIFYGSFLLRLIKVSFLCRKTVPFALVMTVGMLLIASKTGGALSYIQFWYVLALATAAMLIKKKI